jgi:hypothetical protein
MTRIADWELQATALTRKRGRMRSQVFLLHPPPGFVGRAQLDVIAAGRRDEYARAWEAGSISPLVLAAPIEGEGTGVGASERAGEHAPARVSADLRLEVTGVSAGARGGAATSQTHMGAITGDAPPPHATRIDVVPLLAGHRADQARELPRMLRAMRRDAALRVSLTGAWPAFSAGAAGGARATHGAQVGRDARELSASGRIEWLLTAAASARESRACDLIQPPRTAILATALSLADIAPADIAARLSAMPASVSALLLPAGATIGGEAWPAAARLVHGERALVVCAPAEAPASDAWHDPFSSRLVGFIDGVLRRTAIAMPKGGDPRHLTPGCWLQPLATPADLLALRALVRDWNRHYASPQLWFATATDYTTALEELLLQGHMLLPEITIA